MQAKPLTFTKMHALGNDFVIINGVAQIFNLNELPIASLADRHVGIGFDQLLIVQPSKLANFACQIFNADGSKAEQCVNGIRCVARFLHEEKLFTGSHVRLETSAGIFSLLIHDFEHISISMGSPEIVQALVEIELDCFLNPKISIISLGNPHAILKVSSLEEIDVTRLGKAVASKPFFPNGVNVGFMEIIDPEKIRLRTFERGSGATFACGSNAAAAVIAGVTNGWLKNQVIVEFAYGSLEVAYLTHDHTLRITGPATTVFSGQLRF